VLLTADEHSLSLMNPFTPAAGKGATIGYPLSALIRDIRGTVFGLGTCFSADYADDRGWFFPNQGAESV
jgi:hypothetical protein